MLRLLCIALVAFALSSCATYDYYGDDRYYDDGYYQDDTAAPAYSGYGGASAGGYGYGSGYGGSVYEYPYWSDYPAYYSVFWNLNRSWVDPYWHPHFYYGVTWFPRNYFSVSYRYYGGHRPYYSHWGPHYGYLSYSPYRSSWSDYYYDWYPWYSRYPNHHNYYAPRYGNARNEAERLARLTGAARTRSGYYDDGLPASRFPLRSGRDSYGSYADRNRVGNGYNDVDRRRDDLRGADYRGNGNRRADPGAGGFGSVRGAPDYRDGRAADRGLARGNGERVDPRVGGFGSQRGGDYGRSADAVRGADNGYDGRGRSDPRVGGFNTPRGEPQADTRYGSPSRYGNERSDPRVGGFQPPRQGEPTRGSPRPADRYEDVRGASDVSRGAAPARGDQGIPYPYNSRSRELNTAPRRETPRYTPAAPPTRAADRGIASPDYRSGPSAPRYERPREPVYQAPRQPTRYEAPARQPSYSPPRAEPRWSAPPQAETPRYQPSREPAFSKPERESSGRSPVFERAPERSEPRESRESRDDGGRGARGELGRLRDE